MTISDAAGVGTTMLRSFTLSQNNRTGKWELKNAAGVIVCSYRTKTQALAGNKLQLAVGRAGGRVIVHKRDGRLQEVRIVSPSASLLAASDEA